ncbi:MAG: DUF2141 domain-containing protein [Gammaproteobacteria bacterium]|nr:DUF2141 domain-containing protein [Gammaproteobacteria bacterium]QOJ31041.1 MAG: DUF2141 domain-containing protein [Gammaproteobacteria bacterium]
MRVPFIPSCLLLLGAVAPLAPATATALRITATNVQDDAGSIVVLVYDSADHWLSERWRTRKRVPVAGQRVDDTVTLELDLPPGQYAFSVFQDRDDDGRLARNFLGMPKEPAGLSNNLRPRLGPPRFRDALFTLGEQPLEQRIRLE